MRVGGFASAALHRAFGDWCVGAASESTEVYFQFGLLVFCFVNLLQVEHFVARASCLQIPTNESPVQLYGELFLYQTFVTFRTVEFRR
jgi:hypothetical protein